MKSKKTKPIRIAIDATAGSGSTSLALRLAKHYKLRYLDTGKVYRWCALQIIRKRPKNKNYPPFLNYYFNFTCETDI